MPTEVRPIGDAELPAWFEAASSVFFMWPWGEPQATADFRKAHMDLDRTRAAFDGDRIVGTFRTFPTPLTVPGGGSLTASAVTAVTVRSTHRRRGILSAMQADDIARASAAGEAVGVLIASEWPIYGRYGYGPATWRGRWTLRTRAARFKADPIGTVEVVAAKRARELIPGIYERYRAGQPGEIGRTDFRWDVDLGIVQPPGRPKVNTIFAIHRAEDGTPDGYATYHGEEKWDDGIPDNVLILDELHGASEPAELALWQYLASIDLVATINADTRRAREPLMWHLEDARALRLRELGEFLWVRLFDVPAALTARGYERSDRLVIDVVDRLGGGNGPATGRFELDASPHGATCLPTRRDADVTLDVAALGAAYLGGTRLRDAVRAGGATESTTGALARADALLATADEPWCSTWF
ncbi:MAG: GNAT family N-acetyltransferase [Chloroflexi bacterium]|nr:GNAT family N-acetyltransferase [Chloroflexota bacterium]